MKLFPLALFAAAMVALSALAAACGGGGGEEVTVEEYFQRLDVAVQDADARSQALPEDPSPDSTFEEWKGFLNNSLTEYVAIVTDLTNTVADLRPPAEVEDSHNDLLDASRDFREAVKDYAQEVAAAKSTSDLERLATEMSTNVEPIQNRLDESCFALQGIADENEIAVDLECGD